MMVRHALQIPPVYQVCETIAEPPSLAARQAIANDAEDGTLYWRQDPDQAEVAILLRPEAATDIAAALALVGMAAAGDTLGALLAPEIPMVFGWPAKIYVNEGECGMIAVFGSDRTSSSSTAFGLVVALSLRLRDGEIEHPGIDPDRTSLLEEGGADITAAMIAETFARYFLLWLDVWQDDGTLPVLRSVVARTRDQQLARILVNGEIDAEALGAFTHVVMEQTNDR